MFSHGKDFGYILVELILFSKEAFAMYGKIVEAVKADAESANDDAYIDIVSVSEDSIEFYDGRDGTYEYHYVLTNPDCINKDWVAEKLLLTKSCKNIGLISKNILAAWIAQIPAYLLMTLNRIIFTYDDEADWDELYEDARIGD